jgi:hypothetical protein
MDAMDGALVTNPLLGGGSFNGVMAKDAVSGA